MRTATINVYTFRELSASAKQNVIDYFVRNEEYDWSDAHNSLEEFCDKFNVRIRDYCYGGGRNDYIKTDATNRNFRGLKLRDVNREEMPTGYCFDSDLMYEFYDTFKASGDALYAFNQALEAFMIAVANDVEYQCSEDYIADLCEYNYYQFTEDGSIFFE